MEEISMKVVNIKIDLQSRLAEAEAQAKAYRSDAVTLIDKLEATEARAEEAERQYWRYRGFLASIMIQARDKREFALDDIGRAAQIALDESAPSPIEEDAGRLRAALKAVEWTGAPISLGCPWCGGFVANGHKPDCQRQAALSVTPRADAEAQEEGEE